MNIEIKQKVLNDFKQMLEDSKNANIDKDYVKVLQKAIDHPDRVLSIDDEFPWDENRCITHCDGHCCSLSDLIRITPVDFEYMYKSPMLKDRPRREILTKDLQIFLGRDSLMPMGVIGRKPIEDSETEFCPFMAGAMKIELKGTLDNPEFEPMGIGGVCGLGQKYKPNICMLYPLGRIQCGNLKTGEKNVVFIQQKCIGTDTTNKIKVRDHITNYMERGDIYDFYIKTVFNLIKKLKDTFQSEGLIKTILSIFMVYLFEGEKDILTKIGEIDVATDNLKDLFESTKDKRNPKRFVDELEKEFSKFRTSPK